MEKIRATFGKILMAVAAIAIVQSATAGSGHAAATISCPRFAQGSVITPPEDLFSQNGTLTVNFSYQTTVDSDGLTRFCYMLADGNQSPTLHLNPGDTLVLNVTNDTPAPTDPNAMHMQMSSSPDDVCGATTMDSSSTNVHFHGTNASPMCGQDEVIHTLINSGQTFTYNLQIPANEPAGLYWYHPHVHGMSEAAVLGGASGAIVIEGIEAVQAKVAGLPQQLLIVRDNLVPGGYPPSNTVPAWNVSLNYVPIPFPEYPPAVIEMKPREKQFWRVLNASADTIIDVQLNYDRVPQVLGVVALDGVATGSQDGTRRGKIVYQTHILLPPAGRAEFIVTGPSKNIGKAILFTRKVNTGPLGDNDPTRPLAQIQLSDTQSTAAITAKTVPATVHAQRFEGLATAPVTANRKLYFSEDNDGRGGEQRFFITVEGATPVVFSPTNPPAITTTQGSVEDWVVQNRSGEAHEFHIHQIHFLLLKRSGMTVSPQSRQFLDTINIPAWNGRGAYPSVTLRMDFRGPDMGDFVYHCHILQHEDGGMMAIIRVIPGPGARSPRAKPVVRGARNTGLRQMG